MGGLDFLLFLNYFKLMVIYFIKFLLEMFFRVFIRFFLNMQFFSVIVYLNIEVY